MTNVQAACTGAASRVQEEWFALFVAVQYFIKITVTEEQASAEPAVSFVASEPLESLDDLVVD